MNPWHVRWGFGNLYCLAHRSVSRPVINFLAWRRAHLLGLDYFRKSLPCSANIGRLTGALSTAADQRDLLNETGAAFWRRKIFPWAKPGRPGGSARSIPRYQEPGPTHQLALRGFEQLRRYRVPCDILCVVNAVTVCHPERVYRFLNRLKQPTSGFCRWWKPNPTPRPRQLPQRAG